MTDCCNVYVNDSCAVQCPAGTGADASTAYTCIGERYFTAIRDCSHGITSCIQNDFLNFFKEAHIAVKTLFLYNGQWPFKNI